MPSDNELLIQINATLDELLDVMAGAYVDVTGDNSVAVTEVESEIRALNASAIKTVVTNLGAETVYVYEGGCLACMIYANETWESPLGGKKAITVKTDAGKTSTVAVATYAL